MQYIYLPIEIKKRELLSRILFSIEASKRGITTIIASKSNIMQYLRYFPKGDYFLKSIQHGTINRINKIKKYGHRVHAFDEEGLMHYDDQFYLRRIGSEAIKKLDYFFLWGDNDHKILSNKFPELIDKFKIAGNGRIDVLKFPFNKFLDREVEEIHEKYGNYILFSTKFGKVNYIERDDINDYIDGQIKSGYIKESNQYLMKLAEKAKKHELENFKNFEKFLYEFNNKFQNKKLLVAIHPGENQNYYKKLIKKFNNIEIANKKFSTLGLIKASMLNISCNCTTSVESYLLGKKSINFLIYQDNDVEYYLPKTISKNIHKFSDLLSYIDKNNYSEISEDFDLDKFNNSIKNVSISNNFAEIVLDVIEKNTDTLEKNFSFFNYFYHLFVSKIKTFLKFPFRSKLDIALQKRAMQKIGVLKLKEIQRYIKSFSKISQANNIIVKEIYPGVFKISRD